MNATENTATTFPAYLDRIAAHGLTVPTEPEHVEHLRQLWTMERKAEESYPQVIPPCPSWCALGAGHQYDSYAADGAGQPYVHTRFHEAYIGRATVGTLESNKAGRVTVGPASVMMTDRIEDITAEQAREVASDLLLAADLLDSITGR